MTPARMLAGAVAPLAAPAGAAARSPAVPLAIVLGLVFVALVTVSLAALGSLGSRDQNRLLAAQIERYGPRSAPAPADDDGAVARTAVDWVTRLLRSSNAESGLAARLDLAGISQRPGEWVVLGSCASVVLAVALTVLLGNVLVGMVSGALAGWLGMRLAVSVRIGRRRAAFGEQLPDVLQLLAASLESGFSLSQALTAVVREETQPSAGEFSRALSETRIGATMEEALQRVADRMDCTDLRWTVMAIRIQREVGGNLGEVLRNTMATMRERAQLRRHVRALSAEGRLSAYVLLALPLAIGTWMFMADWAYMRTLYTTGIGLLMLGVTVVLFTIGWFWMRKVIKVEM